MYRFLHCPHKTLTCLSIQAIALCLASAVPASGSAAEKIVVMDLQAERGLDKGLAKLLNELILTEFQKAGKYEVFGERDIVSMMSFEDTKIKLTGCTDDNCLAEIGGALGVDMIVASNIGKVGDNYLLNMKMLDVKRAVVKKRVSEITKAEENALLEAVRKAVASLCGTAAKNEIANTRKPSAKEAEKEKPVARTAAVKIPAPVTTKKAKQESGGVNLPAWISLGVGLAAAATGGVLGGLALSDKDLAGRSFDSQSEYDDTVDGIENKALAADVMFGVAGAALVGSALFFLFWDDDEAKPAASLAPLGLPFGGGLAATGIF